MAYQKPTLLVSANPYHELDAEGLPIGAVLMPGTSDRYLGAQAVVRDGKRYFVFTGKPESVPLSDFWLRKLQSGEALPHDKATAERARLDAYGEPALGAAAKAAHELLSVRAGKDTPKKLQPIPTSENDVDKTAIDATRLAPNALKEIAK